MYRVYIIEIMPKWFGIVAPGIRTGQRCFYVGETGRNIEERYREHRTGESLPGRRPKRPATVFGRMRKRQDGRPLLNKLDLKLRLTLSDKYLEVASQVEAQELEGNAIDDLRKQGHSGLPEERRLGPFRFVRPLNGGRSLPHPAELLLLARDVVQEDVFAQLVRGRVEVAALVDPGDLGSRTLNRHPGGR